VRATIKGIGALSIVWAVPTSLPLPGLQTSQPVHSLWTMPSSLDANFVTKVDPTGSAVVYSTLLKGVAGVDFTAVDAACQTYMTWTTAGY
jgi:hypothetical protein